MKAYLITYNAIFAVCIFLCTAESEPMALMLIWAYVAISIYLFARNKKACYRALRKSNIKIARVLNRLNM